MAKRFAAIDPAHREFIAAQKIFFVGTATADSRVSVSPKGMDSFAVLSDRRVAWLNVTGSGNETAAHVQIDPRMTIMFCAFDGPPLILRLYGRAQAIHSADPAWQELIGRFPPLPGARQIFDMAVDLVTTSCGAGVPRFDYAGDRDELNAWARAKGEAGIRQYWRDRNQESIDGIPTHIVGKSG